MEHHEEKEAPTKLIRVSIQIDGNGHRHFDELHEEFQKDFLEIEQFTQGDSIRLMNKNYSVKSLSFIQHNGKTPSSSSRGEQIITTYLEVGIRLDLGEQ